MTITAFISYSHDSPEHEARVLALAERLRSDGIDCDLDAWVETPPQGWPSWMREQVRDANFVLVVCTETYERRVSGKEQRGRGLGAAWEGTLISQRIYDDAGRNERFIPVIFRSEDAAFIPDFLKPTTHYDISRDQNYDRLYRRLTRQPARTKPPLGTIRTLTEEPAPIALSFRWEQLALLQILSDARESIFVLIDSLVMRDDVITVVATAASDKAASALSGVGRRRPEASLAFRDEVHCGRVTSVTRKTVATRTEWTLHLTPEEPRPSLFSEVTYGSTTADEIAQLRARRILLDEKVSGREALMESFIRGMNVRMAVTQSPLPALFRELATSRELFSAAAPLVAATWLVLSNTVSRIRKLDLRLQGESTLFVDFEGERPLIYSNVAPAVITVHGTCDLTG